MSYYDDFLNFIKERYSKKHMTNENVSGAIASELIVISSLLITALLLRHISVLLTGIVIIILIMLIVSNLPLSIKLFDEQDDSLDKMMFYTVITLGIIVSLIYWSGF
ncbi:energy-converting hydrogenase B subunit G EhbG [Methanobrevibacter sp. 87.7]|uniref:energy-converting hydrogenase B subunit G EhbG n=1 Tax=Methanobrevibacter sp. 87.7 TaxID=387957 RepID=UPI000B4FEED4|nr:energy-converting hydrogenase B subunit G EhbG [Methanobrevibacter sp. 87.7]OWT33136.1 energy-converting hydrogenase B subunit G EhbG [Methanobrevibacter sp. 87.7]